MKPFNQFFLESDDDNGLPSSPKAIAKIRGQDVADGYLKFYRFLHGVYGSKTFTREEMSNAVYTRLNDIAENEIYPDQLFGNDPVEVILRELEFQNWVKQSPEEGRYRVWQLCPGIDTGAEGETESEAFGDLL